MVDGAVPEFFVKVNGQGVQFAQFKHHTADGYGIGFHSVPLLLQRRQSGFGFFEAAAQVGACGEVGFFRCGIGGIFCDTQAQEPSIARQNRNKRTRAFLCVAFAHLQETSRI